MEPELECLSQVSDAYVLIADRYLAKTLCYLGCQCLCASKY